VSFYVGYIIKVLSIELIIKFMLTTIAVILLVLWLIGFIALPSLGWVIHILLVVAIIMFLIRIIQGRNPLS
jgi:hypothetical protein